MRFSLSLMLIWSVATSALANEVQFERVKRLLAEGLLEAAGQKEPKPVDTLVAQGLSSEDAKRVVHDFFEGFADCLLNSLRPSSNEQIDLDELDELEQALDRSDLHVVVRDLTLIADESADVCVLAVVQQAGFPLELFNIP